MYTVASPDPDPDPRGGGQLPNPNECNSTLTSGTSGGIAPTYTNMYILSIPPVCKNWKNRGKEKRKLI